MELNIHSMISMRKKRIMIYDTICAIATPFGTGGISVIRVTGADAIAKVNSIFSGADLTKQESHTIIYGFVLDKNKKNLDEVLISIMKAPKTFTTEDVVEISTHGGVLITKKVLERVLSTGIRLAERGEFTQRAFLNGRIDLIQAEAINDLIHAKNDSAILIANQGVGRETSKLIMSLRDMVLELVTKIEVNIDYPEYEDEVVMTKEIIIPKVKDILREMEIVLKNSLKTKMIKEGIKTAIIGKPNVGKSSLLNALLEEERAIVTDYAGTTRDTIEAQINLGDITLNLVDTAGIRETKDEIEKMGISRSVRTIEEAELVLLVMDQSTSLDKEDKKLLELTKNKKRIIILNKSDLPSITKIDNASIISVKNKKGIKELENRIISELSLSEIEMNNYNYLSNSRQIGKLEEAKNVLENVLSNEMPVDILSIDITKAFRLLSEILGDEYQETLINELFARFCLGK